jgi:hypothetical protein
MITSGNPVCQQYVFIKVERRFGCCFYTINENPNKITCYHSAENEARIKKVNCNLITVNPGINTEYNNLGALELETKDYINRLHNYCPLKQTISQTLMFF